MKKIKIVTFNLRCVWDGDGQNAFIHRVGMIYDKLTKELPDIVAFQEVREQQLELLRRMLVEYEFFGQGRDEKLGGEGLYVAVRRGEFSLTAYETFWISPTPSVPASRFDDQSVCPRICNVVELRHKGGKALRIFNLHLDHVGDGARLEGMKCVMAKVGEHSARQPLPTIILGDFNASPDSPPMRYLDEFGGGAFVDLTRGLDQTFHNWGVRNPGEWKIDYIYLSREAAGAAGKVGLWEDEHEGIFLSDHYPVFVELELEKL